MVTLEWTNNERGGREGSGRAKVGMDREREREREKGGSDQESGCELSMNMSSVTSKKSPKVDISCPKMIPLEKWNILTFLQKLPLNMGELGKIIITTGFEKLPQVQ